MYSTDLRQEIVNSVIIGLEEMSKEMVDQVRDMLFIVLNKYEVQERCTAVTTTDTTSEDYLKAFIITKRIEGMSEQTLTRYYDDNMKLIQTIGKPIKEMTTNDLRYYLALKRTRDHNSNVTLEGIRHCWSSFFGWLTKEEIITKNPCLKLSQIKCPKQVKLSFSAVDLDKIKRACMDNPRDLALVDFLYSTGCRVSEVSALDVADVDFEKKEIVVLGKGDKQRKVYLTDVAALHLKEYLNGRKVASKALFTSKSGKRLSKNGIEAACKRLEKRSGVENIHPHRFRRTLITDLLNSGMAMQEVSILAGHESVETTQIYYSETTANVKSNYLKYSA